MATLRRLTCDASLVRITENEDGEPLDVGRKTRTIPPAIRRALHARDPGCCFPGCASRRHLDAHHVEHWADGGATKLANLVSLCRLHHRLVHEGDIRVETREGGGWQFRRPDGREFEVLRREPAPSYHWSALGEANAARGIVSDARTAATRWQGERLDYHLAIPILCAQAGIATPTGFSAPSTERGAAAGDASAETSASDNGDDVWRYWNGTAWCEYDGDAP